MEKARDRGKKEKNGLTDNFPAVFWIDLFSTFFAKDSQAEVQFCAAEYQ